MPESLEPRYDHKAVEEKIYKQWEESGYFNPDNLEGEPFTIIMPPANANGALHIGHAFEVALQDLMIRFWRMRGRRALWLPGADHAGFETQVVFEKKLEKEGRNRFQIDRDALWKEMWEFTQTNKKIMEGQLRRLGASADWSREKFTLDSNIIETVYKTFKKLYDDDLIYRDVRVVNWCPKHKTALSDLEVKYVERTDPLYYIKYGPLSLATVRPETKFGDTALAVNPKDSRYKKLIGKEIEARGVLGLLKFKVIGDGAVDPKFGTGVVKVTPAHDATDFEIWARHKDEIAGPKVVIDENGRLTGEVGSFAGLKVSEAREKIVEEMKKIGILEKIDSNYIHQVATCYKCNTTLEPIPKMQWWVKMKPLAAPAIKAVKEKKMEIIPKRFEKTYLHWLENIRDWNISRQIVWGIRIPAWYHEPKCTPRVGREKEVVGCKEIVISAKKPRCEFCDADFVQETDVFDTWFSSGQWPFATLGFPNGKDFKTFYPTDVMAPGYEILFFWVTRMVMLGLYRTSSIPFKTVYLHGMVRDKDRQKMSKSKGNVIDPLGVADIYGTDAMRFALVAGSAPGSDQAISEDKIRGYRNFVTKIWNIARFIVMSKPESIENVDISKRDEVKELKALKTEVTAHIEDFEFHLAAEKLYHYVWHTLADNIVETEKKNLRDGSATQKSESYALLEHLLLESIKMLHPFMPFVTEEIYQKFSPGKMLMIEKW